MVGASIVAWTLRVSGIQRLGEDRTMNPVTVTRQGAVALVMIDHPPVNALSHAVRAGLVAAVEQIDADPEADAAVLMCAGRTFIAGADIKEFGKPPLDPILPTVIERIERANKPWIAAIHGSALGGGLEVAMGCRYRVADQSARLGFPEVNLGLIPGAGGTVRLPRLVPVAEAVSMISGGKPIGADKALELGLIDHLSEGDLLQSALDFAAGLEPSEPVIDRSITGADRLNWDELSAKTKARAKGQIAPLKAVEAVRRSTELPAKEALAAERRTFIELRDGEQSAALRYLFQAERRVSSLPEIKGVEPRPVERIAIIGGGTMGAGIAAACLLARFGVTIIERDAPSCEKARSSVGTLLEGSLKRGLIDAASHEGMIAAFACADSFEAAGDADLVIEAVFEDMAVKQEVFAKLDGVTKPNAVLATNTSYLDVNQIAGSVTDPSRVLGLHFFSPAHIVKLLEIIKTDSVAPDVLATGFALAKKLRKIAVPAGVCDGFIGNRIMSAYRRHCDFMLEDGALPQQIDAAMVEFGFPMGLFAMQDMAGLDISWATRKRQAATRNPKARYVAIADKLCEMGRFGRKTGAGWYDYSADPKKGQPDPVVDEIILAESAAKGIQRKPFGPEDIMRTILGAMQQEGRDILSEGIAASPEAIDVVMTSGYGFPRWRGGPMFMQQARAQTTEGEAARVART